MGYMNFQFADGSTLSIASGEVVPFAGLHQDPRQTAKPVAQETHDLGMGDGTWPPNPPPPTI